MYGMRAHTDPSLPCLGPRTVSRVGLAAAGALIILACVPLQQANGAEAKQETCTLESGRGGLVTRVADSETFVLDDGTEVRLIGALAPHAPVFADEKTWPPERAATQALEALVLGRNVQLAFAGRRIDRYGRLLAHAFIMRDGERLWVQGELLRHGHARAYGLPGNFTCMTELLAHERIARDDGTGLWANSAYRVRNADRSRDLMRLRNSYQIVEGVVREAADVRGHIYLNFGDNWRNDFTAGIAASVYRDDQAWHNELKGLTGKRVRVRGWIERRNGPFIEVADRGQIEVIGDDPDTSPSRRQTTPPAEAQTSSQRTPLESDAPPTGGDNAKRPAQDAPGALNL
jgi:micrococcal nuclease